jgi:hypothetical protein
MGAEAGCWRGQPDWRGNTVMSVDNLKVVLTGLEAEVVEEALELYVQVRPVPIDGRFEYRYRAARSVLESLRQGSHEHGMFPRGDDEEANLTHDGPSESRPRRERTED